MADNVAITAGSGTAIAADEISSAYYQRVKLIHGADGVNDGDVSSANPPPVTAAATLAAETSKVIGTVNVASSQTIGLAAGSALVGKVSIDQATANANEVVVKSISAGNNNIGDVDVASLPAAVLAGMAALPANSGVDIGDVTINNAAAGAAVNIQDGGNSITVDGSVTATLSAETSKIIGTVNVAAAQTIAATNAGTFAVQDSEKVADSAGFSPGTTKVQPAGFEVDDTSTVLAHEGDAGIARMTADRRQLVQVGGSGGDCVTGTASATSTGDTSVIAGAGSGWFLYITSICGYNASTTDTYVNIKDGTTTRLVLPLAAKGGFTLALPTPLRLADNAALQFACPGGVTTAYVSAVGYKANC